MPPPFVAGPQVLLPVANMQQMAKASKGSADAVDGASYAALVDAGRAAVLAALERACGMAAGELATHIVDELVIDPPQWKER